MTQWNIELESVLAEYFEDRADWGETIQALVALGFTLSEAQSQLDESMALPSARATTTMGKVS